MLCRDGGSCTRLLARARERERRSTGHARGETRRRKAGKKNQGEAKRDEYADSLVVESASADPIQRLPSAPGSAKRNGAINYHGGDGAALQLQHLE